jgi:hypothetical protein
MLTVFENAVTDSEILHLQQQFAELKSTVEFNERYLITNPHEIRELYNSDAKSLTQQERVVINAYPVANVVRSIVNRDLPAPLKDSISIRFSRSVYPVGIHTDTNERDNEGHTIMIPLTSDPRIKTVVWQETAVAQAGLNAIFQRFQTDRKSFRPQPRISNKFDLRNCWLGRPSIVDFLQLDGVAEWHTGSIFKFERQQLHASNNYREFVEFKDYVLIHNDE